MDTSTSYPDPFRDAMHEGVQRAVQLGSIAVAGAQIYAYHQRAQARTVAERDERARRALQAQIRAERDAARAGWAPALDPAWLQQATFIETARAWGAALPYSDRAVPWYEPTAVSAMRTCEDRLRDLHPFGMARYDRLRSDGLSPAAAMREAAPLFALHPQARDGYYTPRAMLQTASPNPAASLVLAPRTGPPPAGTDPVRVTRPCDEDFPLTIHQVLAIEAKSGSVVTTEEPASPAIRQSPGNVARP
jgi:hypothetical protein